MKREAAMLRRTVRELARELAEENPPMPANEFLITNHQNRVVSVRLFARAPGDIVPLNINSQQACELAAWLLVAASLGEHMNFEEAHEYFETAYREALNS